jgi:hypothetical protein
MNKAIEALKQYLEKNDWPHEAHEDGLQLRGVIKGDNGRWEWYAEAGVENEFLLMRGLMPVNVPEMLRPVVGEYLLRVNCSLRWGNFDMDWSDGSVAFRTYLALFIRRKPTTGQLGNLLAANCWAMDRYLPGLMSVIRGQMPPKEAFEKTEAEPQQQQRDAEPDAKPELRNAPPAHLRLRMMPGEN